MVVAIGDVRMPAVLFVRSLFASLPVRVACRVEWTVSGQMRPGMRCPEGCPIVASIWTPDTTARIWDGDQACGRSGSSMGAGGHDGRVPRLVAAGVGRRGMRIAVLSGQGQDE
jgi:hypothetical protein